MFSMIVDIFRRAAAHQPLTPAERTFRTLVIHTLLFQLLTGLVAAGQGVLVLFGSGSFAWQPVAITAAITFGCSLLSAAQKWTGAQGDAPMADALGIISRLAQQFQSGGSAAFLAALHQTDRTNFVLKLVQGMMQLQVPSAPAVPAPPAPVQSPPLIERQPMQAGAANG